jgi:hypothetical protein
MNDDELLLSNVASGGPVQTGLINICPHTFSPTLDQTKTIGLTLQWHTYGPQSDVIPRDFTGHDHALLESKILAYIARNRDSSLAGQGGLHDYAPKM